MSSDSDSYGLASAISDALPEVKLLPQAGGEAIQWSQIVEQKQELWPIQFLLPGGAYIH